MEKIKCPICGTEIEDEQFVPCPCCEWAYTGYESIYEEDEKDEFNFISRKKAKENLKNGLNIWGYPLKYKI